VVTLIAAGERKNLRLRLLRRSRHCFCSVFFPRGDSNVKSIFAAWLSAIFILSSASSFAAVKPIDEIRVAVTKAIQILKEPGRKSQHESKEIVGQLRKTVEPIFDFREMAKRSLGPHWRDLTSEERQAFVPLFRNFLGQVYLDRITSHDVEKVLFSRETLDKDYAEVDTKVIAGNGDQVPIVYLLKRVDGDWKVYDLIIDNVSIVNNYRAQFDRVIFHSSYKELVKRIRQRIEAS
jgi:phospholipid transport system substrate-binding protein